MCNLVPVKNIFSSLHRRSESIDFAISAYLCSAVEVIKQNKSPDALIGRELFLKNKSLNIVSETLLRIINLVVSIFIKNNAITQLLHKNQIAKNILLTHRQITCLSKTKKFLQPLSNEKITQDHLLSLPVKINLLELQKFQLTLCKEQIVSFQKVLKDKKMPLNEKNLAFDKLPPFLQTKLIKLAKASGISQEDLKSDVTRLNEHENIIAGELKSLSKAIKECDASIEILVEESHKKSGESYDPKHEVNIYDVSMDRLYNRRTGNCVKTPTSVVMVGTEYAGLIKEGGLSEALEGLAKGIKTYNPDNQVTLIFPKLDILPDHVLKDLKNPTSVKYSNDTEYKVYTYNLDGVEVHFIESKHIDLPEGHLNVYGPSSDSQNERFAAFSAFAADHIQKMEKKPKVVHLHDWHVAGVGLKLLQGQTKDRPAVVFTFHNNASSSQGEVGGAYSYSQESSSFVKWGLVNQENPNLFILTTKEADVVNTVSETFAKEAQCADAGKGASFAVREAAKAGKLFGIINGSDPTRWHAELDATLKNWKDPKTNESVDLSYGADHADISLQKQKSKEQLQKWIDCHLEKNQIKIDPNKPLVTYIGRYDSYQKGLHRFDEAIQETLSSGGQFICMGTSEDEEAKKILDKLEKKYAGTPGVWIIRDFKDKNKKLFFQQGNETRPGIGSLVRSATDVIFMPSSFEPCGLTYREGFGFGSLAVCSNKGGPVDLIVSPEKDQDQYNGYLFKLEDDNVSTLPTCKESLSKALSLLNSLSKEKKNEMMGRLLETAKKDSWVSSPERYSPVEKYLILYEQAIKNSRLSKKALAKKTQKPIQTFQTPLSSPENLLKEKYLASFYNAEKFKLSSEDLCKMYEELPMGVQFQVPSPYGIGTNVSLYKQFGASYQKAYTDFSYMGSQEKISSVQVVLYNDDEEVIKEYSLKRESLDMMWKVRIPNILPGQKYTFKIDNHIIIDPFARKIELPKDNREGVAYAVVVDPDKAKWSDQDWMKKREETSSDKPMLIYETHLGALKKKDGRHMNYRELAPLLAEQVKKLGFTHVELMGLLDHPKEVSWGYQVTGFFAPNHRFGSVDDFKYFIDYLHKQDIGVVLDFVPNHFAVDQYGLTKFQERLSNKKLSPWNFKEIIRRVFYSFGSNLFDLSQKNVRDFLIASAHFWTKEMHIDGLRIDCLSGLLSADKARLFLRDFTQSVHKNVKGVKIIAEDFSGNPAVLQDIKNPNGLGFDSKWNVSWNHFVLKYFGRDLAARRKHYGEIRKAISESQTQKHIAYLSHDEFSSKNSPAVVKKWMSEGHDLEGQKDWRNLLTLFMMTPGNKLLFSGLEFNMNAFWDQFIGKEMGLMDSHENLTALQTEMQKHVSDLSTLYKEKVYPFEKAEQEWIKDDKHIVHAYSRTVGDQSLVVLHNFTDQTQEDFLVTIPKSAEQIIGTEQLFITSPDTEIDGLEQFSIKSKNKEKGDKYYSCIKLVQSFPDKNVYKIRVPKQNTLIIKAHRLNVQGTQTHSEK